MKTRRTFLKLFVMACFLAVLWSGNAKAAGPTTLTMSNKDIYIGNDKAGYGDPNITTGDNAFTPVSSDIKDGYIITGSTIGGGHNIIIDLTANTNLYLTFRSLEMAASSHIEIRGGNVEIRLEGINSVTSTDNAAISQPTNSTLTFSSSSNSGVIQLKSGNGRNTIDGGTVIIENGTVTLNKEGNGSPFEGESIKIKNGTLNCYDGGNLTEFNNGTHAELIIDGGKVNAAGLVGISYENDSLKDLTPNRDYSIRVVGTDGETSTIGSGPEGMIGIKADWFGKSLKIDRQQIIIPNRPGKPSIIKKTDETVAGEKDGTITFPSNYKLMQYKSASSNGIPSDWTTPLYETIEGLSPGDYQIRNQATATAFSSEYTTITIEKGRILTIKAPEFAPIIYGTASPATSPVSIKNHDANPVTIKAIKWESGAKDWYELTTSFPFTINNGATNDSGIMLKPNDKLDADTYTTKFDIAFTLDGSDTPEHGEVTVTFTVNRAEQKGPADHGLAIQADTITYNSVILKPLTNSPDTGAKINYRVDGGNWQESPEFKGLSSNEKHVFEACYAATKNYNISPAINADFTTEKAATILYDTSQLDVISGREYEISGYGATKKFTSDTGLIDIDDKWYGKTLTLKDYKSTQTLKVPALPKTPTPKSKDETIAGATDGEISGLSASMQFRKKTGKNSWTSWDAVGGKVLEGLEPGTYEVRTAATDKSFASKPATVVILKGRSLDVTVTDFEDMVYGSDPVSRVITIENLDKENPVNIEGVAVASNAFTITDGDKTIKASETSDTWKVQPKAKLNVDTYTAELTVTYTDTDEEEDDNSGEDETPNEGDDTTGDDETTGGSGTENDPENPSVKAQAEGDAEDVEPKPELRTVTVPVALNVVKAQQDAPPVPAEKSKTATSITLETIPNNPVSGAKAQYSKDGGKSWQDSPTFTGLSPNREYTFVARYAETDNYNASEISSGEIAITTDEKNDDDSNGVNSNANGNNGTNGNGTNGNGTNGTGTGTNGTGTGTNGTGTGTNGTGTGTNGTNGSSSNGLLSSAKTGDLNNIQLWVTLLIGSYLSCAIIVKSKLKKA